MTDRLAAVGREILPGGTALKNRATLPDCCDYAIECGDGEGHRGPELVDAFIARIGEMQPGAMIFVRCTLLAPFFQRAFPLIRQPFVLATGGSDHASPGPYRYALDDSRLIRWFAENGDLVSPHPKFEPLPIGIADPNWPSGDQAVMLRLHERMPAVEDKPLLAHASFHLTISHPSRREALAAIRDIEGVMLQQRRVAPELLWLRHAGHAFEISPRGNGMDCHRTWEALLLRSIPIVKHSALDALYRDFPIAMVDDWREISLAAMRSWRDRLKGAFTPAMYARLTRDYWVERIRAAAGR
jgi:hypothetical protein